MGGGRACGRAVPVRARGVGRSGESASADVTLTGASQHIPRSFYGLSIEYNELPGSRTREPILRSPARHSLRAQNGAPLLPPARRPVGPTPRRGGKMPPRPRACTGFYELTQNWLDQLVALVRRRSPPGRPRPQPRRALDNDGDRLRALAPRVLGSRPGTSRGWRSATSPTCTSSSRTSTWNGFRVRCAGPRRLDPQLLAGHYRHDYRAMRSARSRPLPGSTWPRPDVVSRMSPGRLRSTGLGALAPLSAVLFHL